MTTMVQDTLTQKLGDYVEDALALEEGIVDNLDSMIRSLDELELAQMLQRHRLVSRGNAERLKRRLEQLERGDLPIRKKIEGVAVSLVKGVSDAIRSDAPGKVGRDAYVLASTQIAAYELLKRLAASGGDTGTARARGGAPGVREEARRRDREPVGRVLRGNVHRLGRLDVRRGRRPHHLISRR